MTMHSPFSPLAAVLLATAAVVSAQSPNPRYDREAQLRIQNFTFEPDFKVELFADQTQVLNPSAICFDDQGRLYVAEIHRWRAGVEDIRHHIPMLLDDLSITSSAQRTAMYRKFSDSGYIPFTAWTSQADRIRIVEDRDGDGRADAAGIFADGFKDALDGPGIGLLYGDGGLYYTSIPHLWRIEDQDRDGKSEKRVSLQDGFGVRMSISGHDMHGLIWGPDGRIYWSLGDRGYHFTTKEGKSYSEPTEGAVFRCDPDGSNLEVVYYGLRNPQELAFDQYGNLFTCDNDADAVDTGRLVYILEGGDSGWDAGHQAILNFSDPLKIRTPSFPGARWPLNPWIDEKIWEPRNDIQPAWALPPIEKVSWGPSGLVYNYGATAFPARYAEYFFVCNFGGAKGDLEAFAVTPDGAGFKMKDQRPSWMVGLGNTDAEFGPDGKLYLSCFNNNGWEKQDLGNIYTMFDPAAAQQPIVRETQELLTGGLKNKLPQELSALLGHPDMRVRLQAQFAIAKLMQGMPIFLSAVSPETTPQVKRLHGVWGLGQIARHHSAALPMIAALLNDGDAEVRAQAAKTLADLRYAPAAPEFVKLLNDPNARVRGFAALGIGRAGYQAGLEPLLAALGANQNQDVFLRHTLVMGLTYLGDTEKLAALAKHPQQPVRLGAVLALRRLKSAQIAAYLADADDAVRFEAIRAINDLNLTAALPALAAAIGDRLPKPETPRDWMIHTRLVNANWRLGDAASAQRLLAYAKRPELPDPLRNDALLALKEWAKPNVVDPVIANVRPLDPSKRADLKPIIAAGLPAVLEVCSKDPLVTAMDLAKTYGIAIPSPVLLARLSNVGEFEAVRLSCLKEVAARKEAALPSLLSQLVADPNAEIRAAATRSLLEIDPSKGLDAALTLLNKGTKRDKQDAIEILGGLTDPRATAALQTSLEAAAKGAFDPAALLELLEAAAKRPELKPRLDAYTASLNPADKLAPFRECLDGGDVKRGEIIFATHAAAQCSKCHVVGASGGTAGPNLSDIGKRHNAEYVLAALVDPSAVIVPGYGLTIVFMKDGSSAGGSVLEDTPEKLVLKIGEDGKTQTLKKADIQMMNPPISAMPPMGLILPKHEVRDLVAFLMAQKNSKAAGH